MRSSGEPYVTHPIEVTHYLATLQMDAETLAAALLHDVPEDTDMTIQDIEKRFGREVGRLVDGVTKLSKFGSARSMEEQQAENIRKMFMAMAEDVRVVIIKLADRLHNMRTLEHLPADKQARIARQTMEIYAPLAHRLGMWQIKWELEDLAFKYLEPDKYRQLVEMLTDRRRARESFVNKSIGILRKELAKVGITAEISGRPKHLYSIAKKMERKGAEFTEGLKLDVFQDQVFVFTPKGDVKDLPRDATPLDFAYRIHTDVGHRTIGAKVNNRLVPLDYKLRNGDIVEIVTTKAAHGPSRDWLNIVRTSHAREKIRAWFKRQQRDENIAQGKELLDRELRRLAHETLAGIDAAKLADLAAQYKYKEIDDFYAAIGYGAVSSASVVSKLEIHDDVAIALHEEVP